MFYYMFLLYISNFYVVFLFHIYYMCIFILICFFYFSYISLFPYYLTLNLLDNFFVFFIHVMFKIDNLWVVRVLTLIHGNQET